MNWLWTFIFYSIPWELQVAAIALVCVLVLWLLVGVFGFDRVKGWIPGVIVAVAALGALSRQRQAGYTDRRAEEEKALDHAEEIVEDERTEVQKLPDVELDKKVDKWTI